MPAKKRKIRVDFKKNRGKRARAGHEIREALQRDQGDQLTADERMSGKGALSRRRTIIADSDPADPDQLALEIDPDRCLAGRVISIVGSHQCRVATPTGEVYVCAVRQILRTLSQDNRNAVVAGDRVLFEPLPGLQGMIQRVEPRTGTLGRGSGRAHQLIVANIDTAVIVVAAVSPHLKPSLIDRFLISCEKGGVQPVICINKCDLAHDIELLPIAGQYAHLGYPVFLTSATAGTGISDLRLRLQGRQTVFSGQSGVGKSSLLNRLQPGLALKTSEVSGDSGKGRHTTRTALLKPFDGGGWVVDTPGIRQLRLWDVVKEEIEGFFREFRPYVRYCRFPDCIHDHEIGCGIKQAVTFGLISPLRYESYLKIISDRDDD